MKYIHKLSLSLHQSEPQEHTTDTIAASPPHIRLWLNCYYTTQEFIYMRFLYICSMYNTRLTFPVKGERDRL